MKLYEYRSKLHKRDSVIRDAIYNVDMGFNKLVLQEAKQDFYKELVAKREQEYIAAKYDYKFAKIDANGLLDVIDDLYNAKKLYIENKYEILIAKYQILTEVGVLRESVLDE